MNSLTLKNTLMLLAVWLILGCNTPDDPVNPPDLGYNYYPNELNFYKHYEVIDILFNDFTQTTDTVKYELLEVFEEAFTDLEGRQSNKLARYVKMPNSNWQIESVWQSTKTKTRVEQVEENIRIVKLVFPPKIGSRWNGYAFAAVDDSFFEITDLIEDTVVNSLNLKNVIRVEHYNRQNFIERQLKSEKYAPNIGLIHLYYVNLDLQKDSGIIRNMWIKDSGLNFSF